MLQHHHLLEQNKNNNKVSELFISWKLNDVFSLNIHESNSSGIKVAKLTASGNLQSSKHGTGELSGGASCPTFNMHFNL